MIENIKLENPFTIAFGLIGMALIGWSTIIPCLSLIPLMIKTFPALNANITFGIGFTLACTAQLASYFLGFMIGAVVGYGIWKCFNRKQISKDSLILFSGYCREEADKYIDLRIQHLTKAYMVK